MKSIYFIQLTGQPTDLNHEGAVLTEEKNMNIFIQKNKLSVWLKRLLPLVIMLCAGAIVANAQNYTQNEQTCYSMVQGKVPYDLAGNKN